MSYLFEEKRYVEYDASKIRLTDEIIEKDEKCKSLVNHCELYIPEGIYCHGMDDIHKVCPFWDVHPDIGPQECGYCHLTHDADWIGDSFGILWDQCKTCGINDDRPNNIEKLKEIKKTWKANQLKEIVIDSY